MIIIRRPSSSIQSLRNSLKWSARGIGKCHILSRTDAARHSDSICSGPWRQLLPTKLKLSSCPPILISDAILFARKGRQKLYAYGKILAFKGNECDAQLETHKFLNKISKKVFTLGEFVRSITSARQVSLHVAHQIYLYSLHLVQHYRERVDTMKLKPVLVVAVTIPWIRSIQAWRKY